MVARRKTDDDDDKNKPRDEQDSKSPIKGFRRIPRPASTRGKWKIDVELQALVETLEKGDAVEYDIDDPTATHKVGMAMRHYTKLKNLKFRHKILKSKRVIQAWVERIK